MTDASERFHIERATVEVYRTFLVDKYRPPSKGGNTSARHQHRIQIAGVTYSFLAAGTKKWVFKNETISFDWQWDSTGKYRNLIPESVKTWDKNGLLVKRGVFDWKPMRTADARMPASRREQRD